MPKTPPPVEMEDQVSLGDFVELWWAEEAPVGPNRTAEMEAFRDRKQAALRMLRRNRPGFPDPVGSSDRTRLYRLGDLVCWISHTDGDENAAHALDRRHGAVDPLWHVLRALESCAREIGPARCRRLAVAVLVVLSDLDVEPGSRALPERAEALTASGIGASSLLRALAREVEQRSGDLHGVFESLLKDVPRRPLSTERVIRSLTAALTSGPSAVELTEQVLEHLGGRAGGTAPLVTGTSLAQLLVAVGDPRPGESVLDPAAGEGSVLLCAARHAGPQVELIGLEPDPYAWAIAKARFHLHRVRADMRLGKSLDGANVVPMADLVLVDPPFDSRRSYHRWLCLAADARRPGGRAVVALPAVSVETGRREWRDVGAQQAGVIVRCPSRLRTDRGDALVLWGLESAEDERLLVVDASDLGRRRGTLTDIAAPEAQALCALFRDWRDSRGIDATGPLVAHSVLRAAVGSGEWDLSSRSSANRARPPKPMGPMDEALDLARRLSDLIQGPLSTTAAEEDRQALRRMAERLANESEARR